jgi:4-amino-4-deoxy-L-arabinose transferase-like glycosyltransferase
LEITNRTSARRTTRTIILATALVRVLLGCTLGLGIDESYVVSVARPLSLGYFDHPPLHYWIAGAAQWLAGSPPAGPLADLAVRLPFIVLFAVTTWLTFLVTERMFGDRAALWAAGALNLSAVFTLSTASWVLPDGPLMCASLATVYCVVRALDSERARWWLAAGVCGGLAALSKYHAALLAPGVFLYLATTPAHRRWLARPAPYLAVAIAAVMFLPDVIWNAHHGWVSFAFQASRGVPQHAHRFTSLAQNIAGQIGYVLPWVWIPLVIALAGALAAGPRDPSRWLLACLAIWPIGLFTLVSLGGNPGLPHWTALGYLMCFPLFGQWAAGRNLRVWSLASTGVLVILVSIVLIQALTGVIPLRPSADPTLDLVDWHDLRGVPIPPDGFVAATSWVQAGKVAYALGPAVPVVCLSLAPHQFLYQRDPTQFVGHDALLVIRGTPQLDRYRPYFASIEPIGPLAITRANGRPALSVSLYLAKNYQQPFPTLQPR